jgi:hypothetical protein
MCCKPNDKGGQDCDQIEDKTVNPKGRLGTFPGGVLQNPQVNPSPGTPTSPDQPSGTKPQ